MAARSRKPPSKRKEITLSIYIVFFILVVLNYLKRKRYALELLCRQAEGKPVVFPLPSSSLESSA
jgi:hypothetical protein